MTNITVTWTIHDVLQERPDLTDEEADNVLYFINNTMCPKKSGLSYAEVKEAANKIYPESRERQLKEYVVELKYSEVKRANFIMKGYSQNEIERIVQKDISDGKFNNFEFVTTAKTNITVNDIYEQCD